MTTDLTAERDGRRRALADQELGTAARADAERDLERTESMLRRITEEAVEVSLANGALTPPLRVVDRCVSLTGT